ARVPQTLGRIFLEKTCGEGHSFAGRFDQRLELPHRDRPLFDGTQIKRMMAPDARVPFSLAALPRRAFVQLLDAGVEGPDFFLAAKLRAGRWRPVAFVTAGEN